MEELYYKLNRFSWGIPCGDTLVGPHFQNDT